MRWIAAHKFTLIAVGVVILAIVWLAWSPYTPPKTVWFWQHSWWWYIIWAGSIVFAGAFRGSRRRGRSQQNAMFPGGKPCPPQCRTKAPHTHE